MVRPKSKSLLECFCITTRHVRTFQYPIVGATIATADTAPPNMTHVKIPTREHSESSSYRIDSSRKKYSGDIPNNGDIQYKGSSMGELCT